MSKNILGPTLYTIMLSRQGIIEGESKWFQNRQSYHFFWSLIFLIIVDGKELINQNNNNKVFLKRCGWLTCQTIRSCHICQRIVFSCNPPHRCPAIPRVCGLHFVVCTSNSRTGHSMGFRASPQRSGAPFRRFSLNFSGFS